ncbi:MATE family efflux transporter [Sporanaerobium hydrogeniformans]|uniref:MATE family efflux transporter n=1 Tax=Sporanaerobium hydrogeniformans TaxID=3072179 RepID=A0AC61DBF7_9FIRM|nr:MATE family efflux transporter [Sporanaerobium hydrogeniformans]PHV69932.1 MATE family efflux transporter [Sporanaerobium hydrogeniformans]
MARNYTQDMTKGSPTKLLLMFTIPMLAGNLFQQLYNMVDTWVVGQFVGKNALGAVGATGSIGFLFFSLSFGLGAGIGIIVSQLFGAGMIEKVKRAIVTSFYVMLMSALIMGGLGILLARPVMQLLNTPNVMLEDAVLYLQITCGGLVAVALYNGVASILRALGDTRTPLLFLAVACVINVVLDLLFVVGFNMGVLGVALATIIAQLIAGFGCMLYAWLKVPVFKIPLKEYVPDLQLFRQCIYLGLPVALQNALIAVSCIVLQRVVNGFGPTILAAFTVASRFEQLVHQPFTSLGAAIATYTGQNMGAGNLERVKRGFWTGAMISTLFSLFMLPVAWVGGETIMGFFIKEQDVILEGAKGIRITSLFYAGLGMIYVTRNVLNGCGDVKFAMLSGFVEVAGRVGLAKPLTFIPSIGMLSIWYTTGLTWLITGLISCIRYAQGKWKDKGIVKHS